MIQCLGSERLDHLKVFNQLNQLKYFKVKSTYVETKEQEIFLKEMPRAIDSRIVKERPYLARAIAAEHLIQVFFTHKDKIEKLDTKEAKEAVRQNLGEHDHFDAEKEDDLLEAFR